MKLDRCFYCLLAGLLTITIALGQQTISPHPPSPPSAPASSSYGQTVFSRDESSPKGVGNATAQQRAGSQAEPTATLATDAERTALTYNSYDFEVHLEPPQHAISVRARMTVQNSSDKPLDRIALQLSSSLSWNTIHLDGIPTKFATESVASDIDHTGELNEAVVSLAKPLAPAATIKLDVIYSGTIQNSAERLLRLGAPANVAASSEWDRIGADFTALRGFGNVIWFPVSTAPVLFGQGAQMFDSVGKWKLRESNARITMHLLVEYLDAKPNIAFLNGYVVQPDGSSAEKNASSPSSTLISTPAGLATSTSTTGDTVLRVVSFTLPPTTLGFSPLSFFVMQATHQHFQGLEIYTRLGNESAGSTYEKATKNDRPMVEQWLGTHPKRPVVLVDLPESDDLPFEERNVLFLPLQPNAASDSMGPVMAHILSHAYFVSPRVWLNEGVAQFMTIAWIEQRAGRATAIGQMESRRAALALAEPADPGAEAEDNPGQSLIQAWSDIYYRDKAANVLWMLRDIVGDTSFAKTLQTYDSTNDHEASYLQDLLQKASGKDLEWFFDDWVYRDRGLPDLHIASAYRRPILTKNNSTRNYLVSVDVQNDSYCTAEVPVTVESGLATQTKRLLVPSHTRAALRMLFDSEPDQVLVNDGSVPEVGTSHHEESIRSAGQALR